MTMQIGYAAPLSRAPELADLGYDYIEAPLFAYDVLTPAGLAEAKRSVTSSPLPTLVMNNFFPTDIRIVGPDVDEVHLQALPRRHRRGLPRRASPRRPTGRRVGPERAGWLGTNSGARSTRAGVRLGG